MLKHASIIISLILACFYGLGLSYHMSYLYELGIEESQFQLTLDRIFFQGFMSTMEFSSKGIIWFLVASVSIAAITTVAVEISKAVQKKPSFFSEFVKKTDQKKDSKTTGFHALSETMVGISFGGFTLFVLVLLVLISSGNSGEAYAKKLKQNFVSGKIKKVEVKLKDEEKTIYGNAVICSETQCAYWTSDGSVVLNKRDIDWVKWASEI
ncbi:hypothetical protein [Alteromonas sp. PRIM-21]|uniref:hypothetical protein n=1 Tax=Alteromonas sp. PRIM-21 TaxID=1454978 RepID=UPI0022B9C417|nr:hypothetical protein [Alteromonas sp. PRIM-21]MCZ8529133.1 hypothetical protein [Alteromonas sp. PRIM-21]